MCPRIVVCVYDMRRARSSSSSAPCALTHWRRVSLAPFQLMLPPYSSTSTYKHEFADVMMA